MIRVVFRSYGGENDKGRPPYYSKLLALQSVLRAAQGHEIEFTFINDGPIPSERLRLMTTAGEVIHLPEVGMRQSYWTALTFAASRGWADDDLVWMAEDDYLYHPSAFADLREALTAIPQAAYFALSASTPRFPLKSDFDRPQPTPRGWSESKLLVLNGREWVRAQSTTSTFGARVRALRQDLDIFRLCMLPHAKILRDHDTCLVYQGFRPYRYRDLVRAMIGMSILGERSRLRSVLVSPFLLLTNLRAHRRSARKRLLVVPSPNLATHLDADLVSPGEDWARIAIETSEWAASVDRSSQRPH